jgi:mRNA-degrading endonuclease RelE of RelBE toxin-antitoxin system
MGQKEVPKYFLSFHRKAEKALEALDEKTKQRLLEDIGHLADFTGLKSHLDIVKMQGQKDYYRLRSGKLRTVFFVDQMSKTIIILKIGKRESAYE